MEKIVFENIEYVQIPNYPMYFVSTCGNIYSKKRDIVMLKCKDKNGYERISISNTLGRKSFTVHYLVCLVYIGERPIGHDINHIDYNRSNNRSSNLEYLTEKENMQHSLCNIRRTPVHKYSPNGNYLASYDSFSHAAKENGVHTGSIGRTTRRNSRLKTINGYFYSTEKVEKLPKRVVGRHSPVIVMNLDGFIVGEFDRIKEASLFTGVKHSNISSCCSGVRVKSGNFKFKYK